MLFTLRPSTAPDADWIAELRADVLRDDLTRLGRYDPVRVRERFLQAFVPDHTRVIVINGTDSGCIAVREETDSTWIEHFYLPRAVQGRGIGGSVLESVLASVETHTVRLNVLQGSPARRLYERAGFVVESEDDVDVFMSLTLNTSFGSPAEPIHERIDS